MDTPRPPSPPLPPPRQIQPSFQEEPTSKNDAVTESNTTASQFQTDSSMSITADGASATKAITLAKTKKKQKILSPHSKPTSSSQSSSKFSCFTASSSQPLSRRRGIRLFDSRRNRKVIPGQGRSKQGDIGALALPLGMSIAAVVAQVLKRKDAAERSMSMDHLSQICAGAVQQSLINVYGDKFDGFVENFEKSFRCTLMTLHLINKSSKAIRGEKENEEIRTCSSEVATVSSTNKSENSASDFGVTECWSDPIIQANRSYEEIEENSSMNSRNNQLILHASEMTQQMASVIPSRSASGLNNQSILSTLEKSVMEQARSNDLKTFEMELTMKKLQLKERQLFLSENANLLERWKLSFGFSKASFKVEKFKTQLEDTRHAELLKNCIDCLVAGLLVMLASVGYGTFVYSHKRISEATASCTPAEESKSWWLPNPMASFNSGLQILKCQFQILTRMLAGGILVLLIAYLLLQRSAASNQAMPVTFIVLLLAVACGFAGKLCIDTLGGSGNHWLLYWEILCSLHLFSNLWTSVLFRILNGPINVVFERKKSYRHIPYWIRRCLFYSATCLFLPLLCGFLPFASLGEWQDHFFSLLLCVDDSILD